MIVMHVTKYPGNIDSILRVKSSDIDSLRRCLSKRMLRLTGCSFFLIKQKLI